MVLSKSEIAIKEVVLMSETVVFTEEEVEGLDRLLALFSGEDEENELTDLEMEE